MSKEYELEVEWIPFELHPEVPVEGMKVSQMFPKTPPEYLFKVLNTSAREYGVHFAGADAMYNTHRAHLATEYARDKGKAKEFHDAAFDAYFAEGKNVADPLVLSEITAKAGVDPVEMLEKATDGNYRDRLLEAKKEAYRYGIRSVPTFIFGDGSRISGAQPIKVFRDRLDQLTDKLK